jgi:hypothetical protein
LSQTCGMHTNNDTYLGAEGVLTKELWDYMSISKSGFPLLSFILEFDELS